MRSRGDGENLVVLTMFQIERFIFEMNSSSVCMLFVLSASNCKGQIQTMDSCFCHQRKPEDGKNILQMSIQQLLSSHAMENNFLTGNTLCLC